jgi:hypothetical protein
MSIVLGLAISSPENCELLPPLAALLPHSRQGRKRDAADDTIALKLANAYPERKSVSNQKKHAKTFRED